MIEARCYQIPAANDALQPAVIQRPEPGPTEVLVAIHYCGICHSDLHVGRGELGRNLFPLVPGHEITGTVQRVGEAVSSFRAGDRVGIGCIVDSCRTCSPCQSGEEQFCARMVGTMGSRGRHGETTQGGYSACITVEQDYLLRIPASLSLQVAAPLLCGGITVYSPLRHLGVKQRTRVGVVGMGGLGHLAIKFARAMGATVTVLSSSDRKRADALAMGATAFVALGDAAQRDAYQGELDVIINTVSAPSDVNWLVSKLALDGNMVMVGMSGSATVAMMPLIFRRRSVSGSMIGGIRETQEMLDFAAEHAISPDIERVPIAQVNEAWERLERGDVRYRFVLDMEALQTAAG